MSNLLKVRSLVWVAAAMTFVLLGMLTGVFSFGQLIPMTTDMNPGLYHEVAWHFPPHAVYSLNYWLGQSLLPQDFQPYSLLAHLSASLFFSVIYPLFAALSLAACYRFLRELEFRRGVALLGGVLYAWQGDLLSNILAGHFPRPIIWFLFAVAAFFALRSVKIGSWFYAACCAVATGMMVSLLPDLGGLCSLVIGGLYLVEAWRRRKSLGAVGKIAAQLMLVGALAVAVAMAGIFSTLSWTTINASPAGVETPKQQYDWATQWSYTPEDIINYAVPGFMGWYNGNDSGPYWGRIGRSAGWGEAHEGMRNFCLAIFTLGTVGFILAVGGALLVCQRRRQEGKLELLNEAMISHGRFSVAVAITGWLLALGKYAPFFWFFYQLPFMSSWRNPVKFLAPISLVLVILAACSAERLSRLLDNESGWETIKKRIGSWLMILLAVLLSALILSFPALLPGWVGLEKQDYNPNDITGIFSALRKALFFASLIVGTLTYAWWVLREPESKRHYEFVNPLIHRVWQRLLARENLGRSWLAVLAALNIAQMLWVQSHFVQLYSLQSYYQMTPMLEKLVPRPEPFRISIFNGDPLLRQLLTTVFPYFGVECADIPAYSRMPDDYKTFFAAMEKNQARKLQLSGVKYYVVPMNMLSGLQQDPTFGPLIKNYIVYATLPVAGAPSYALIELKDYLPKVLLVPSVEVQPDEATLLKRLADPSWDPFDRVLILKKDVATTAAVNNPTPADMKKLDVSSRLVHYGDRRIEVETSLPRPAFLLVDDRFDANWKATVNGKPTTIFPANYILRGLTLPAGKSTVVMTYNAPMGIYNAQLIVLALFALWAIGWLVCRGLRPRTPAKAQRDVVSAADKINGPA